MATDVRLLGAYQMLLYRGYGKQGRDRHMVFIHATVCQDQNVGSVTVCTVHLYEQTIDGLFQTGILIIGNRNLCYLEAFHFHML